jgi:predicted alpha/beta-fold hydrolase
MLGCLLGQQGSDAPVDAGVIVSAPLLLEPCSVEKPTATVGTRPQRVCSQCRK